MMALAKITTLIIMKVRYERIMKDRRLAIHPHILVKELVQDAHSMLTAWNEISFIEHQNGEFFRKQLSRDLNHRELYQKLWVNFSPQDYEERIQRYIYRLQINGLGSKWLKGFKCIDFGCGHGNFAHALIHEGARYVCAIDFGKESIAYAIKARDRLGVKPTQIEFKLKSVYNPGEEENTFDFAIQNGVFHHLEDENAAIEQVKRVLKPGGWFWYYTFGVGGIDKDLWESGQYILRNIPYEFTISHLEYLNIGVGKRYFLGDSFNAVYNATTQDELLKRLSSFGFGNFRRLTGGFDTDFDHDVIKADRYGAEKFGEGDLRFLAQKL